VFVDADFINERKPPGTTQRFDGYCRRLRFLKNGQFGVAVEQLQKREEAIYNSEEFQEIPNYFQKKIMKI
jgi:hypothetical protein